MDFLSCLRRWLVRPVAARPPASESRRGTSSGFRNQLRLIGVLFSLLVCLNLVAQNSVSPPVPTPDDPIAATQAGSANPEMPPKPSQVPTQLKPAESAPAGTLEGKVKSGNTPVPGATVSATNPATGEKVVGWTQPDGSYSARAARGWRVCRPRPDGGFRGGHAARDDQRDQPASSARLADHAAFAGAERSRRRVRARRRCRQPRFPAALRDGGGSGHQQRQRGKQRFGCARRHAGSGHSAFDGHRVGRCLRFVGLRKHLRHEQRRNAGARPGVSQPARRTGRTWRPRRWLWAGWWPREAEASAHLGVAGWAAAAAASTSTSPTARCTTRPTLRPWTPLRIP